MIIKELPTPFPFYTDIRRKHANRENCHNGLIDALLCPNDSVLPFQFRTLATSAPTVTTFKLINSITGAETNLSSDISKLSKVKRKGYYNIIYPGEPLSVTIACGVYYVFIELSTGQQFFSEDLKVVNYNTASMPYMRIDWNQNCSIDNLVYQVGTTFAIVDEAGNPIIDESGQVVVTEDASTSNNIYTNRVWLDSYIANSNEDIVEEVEKDGIGNEILLSSKMVTQLKFSEVLPTFLKTAFSAAQLHRNILLVTAGEVLSLPVTRLKINVSEEGSGCGWFVEFTFEVDQVLYQGLCCS